MPESYLTAIDLCWQTSEPSFDNLDSVNNG